jgi:hypothetical protein
VDAQKIAFASEQYSPHLLTRHGQIESSGQNFMCTQGLQPLPNSH